MFETFLPLVVYLGCVAFSWLIYARSIYKIFCNLRFSRINVLGARDAITHELIAVTNDTYINAQSVCDLLWKLHELHPNRPITLVLDNARYQKCKRVSEQAQKVGIDLLYLPPYSPNLNLIERLWKFVKKNCLYSKYYPDFDTFKQAISSGFIAHAGSV